MKHPERDFLLRMSYLEIYNESIKDLLDPTKENMKIHENPNVIQVSNLLSERYFYC
jgi:centromeric protein E